MSGLVSYLKALVSAKLLALKYKYGYTITYEWGNWFDICNMVTGHHVSWTRKDAIDWMQQYPIDATITIYRGNEIVMYRREVRV